MGSMSLLQLLTLYLDAVTVALEPVRLIIVIDNCEFGTIIRKKNGFRRISSHELFGSKHVRLPPILFYALHGFSSTLCCEF